MVNELWKMTAHQVKEGNFTKAILAIGSCEAHGAHIAEGCDTLVSYKLSKQIADKVEGLDSGANDYMEKPFHLQELEARVRSLTRRTFVQKNICLECGSLRFDTRERVAYANSKPITLTRKENGILEYLLLNQGRPVSQEELIEHVWDSSVDSFSGSIRVHMSSLRKKLKTGLDYDPIVNKIGEGYKIG